MLTVEKQVKLFIYIWYLLALIVGCAVGFACLIYSFDETREDRLKIYSTDIKTWETTKRGEFSNLTIKIQQINDDGSNGAISDALGMKGSENAEHILKDEKYGDVPTYEPLYYHLKSAAASYGIIQQQEFNRAQKVSYSLTIGEDSPQEVRLPKLPLYSIESFKVGHPNGCERLHGHYSESGKTCNRYYYLKHICVQVDKDDGGNWYLNKNRNTGEFGWFTRNHNATDFEQIILSPGESIEDKYPLILGEITWEVRSAYDPWLLAMVLTEDSNEFGMTSYELRFIGIGLLFCCGGLTIQPICWIYSKFKRDKSAAKSAKKQGVYRMEDDFIYDEYEANNDLTRGAPPRATSLAGPGDGGPHGNKVMDLDDPELNTARDEDMNRSKKLKPPKIHRKGEYESYYN